MSQDYLRRQASVIQRNSTISSVVIRSHDDSNSSNRVSSCRNISGQFSRISQINLPNGDEYYPQDHLPPIGPEAQQGFYLTRVEDDENTGEGKTVSIRTTIYSINNDEKDEDDEQIPLSSRQRKMLFLTEPILSGMILFPIISLFWQCGWNIFTILLNYSSRNLTFHEVTIVDYPSYQWKLLFFPYLIIQILLLFYYLFQNQFYDYLTKRHWILKNILLKCHIFLLSTLYIIQWKILWTVWEYLIPDQNSLELIFSLTSLFALIVLNGHLADLVASPFLFSYDSIEYSIHFGCPLLTREMKEWKINLINYILYEIIISNLTTIIWIGFYNYLDNYFYPNQLNLSIGLTILIGYILYFPLMYFQRYLEELNLKYQFWTFVSINFPQFYRNIRHFCAFASCVFLWRGYWLFYDTYILIFEKSFNTYLFLYFFSFCILNLIQTSSSINGPLSHINDPNQFYPLYPHCYFSILQRKFRKLLSSKVKTNSNDYQL